MSNALRCLTPLLIFLAARVAVAAPVTAIPASLDLGKRPAGATVRCLVRLVNTGDATLEIASTELHGAAMAAPNPPSRLEPFASVHLPIELRMPVVPGEVAEGAVELVIADGSRVTIPVRAESVPEPIAPNAPVVGAAPWPSFFLPDPVVVNDVAPGATVEAVAWLFNESEAPMEIEAMKPRCGCVTARVSGERIEPGSAARIVLGVRAPGTPGEKVTSVLLVMKGGTLVELPILIRSIHPDEAVVKAFRAARAIGDDATARTLLAPACRIWSDTKDPGRPVLDGPDEPEAAWDRLLHTEHIDRDYERAGNVVTLIVESRGDIERRLGLPPRRVLLTCTVVDGRIASILEQTLEDPLVAPDTRRGRWPQLLAFTRDHAPDALTDLLANTPNRDAPTAERWRALLDRWGEGAAR